MPNPSQTDPPTSLREGKYARIERERRFLLAAAPAVTEALTVRRITDRYLTGTRLRLRLTQYPGGDRDEHKFTQKVPAHRPGAVQGLITTTYLTRAEYQVLATLPAVVLSKTRLSIPPLGIDIFDGPFSGLVLAEAEFTSDEAANAFVAPHCITEVTDDVRFTGGRLASTDRSELLSWLAEFG
ncbi:MAG TPA: hypothetical protein VLL08_23355 [Kineosporiaceae bacterium]|nr:hypothetical protein [Kineosporiaceae bacterium]